MVAKHMRRVNYVYAEERGVSVRVEISFRHTEHRIIIVIRHSIRALCPHASDPRRTGTTTADLVHLASDRFKLVSAIWSSSQ